MKSPFNFEKTVVRVSSSMPPGPKRSVYKKLAGTFSIPLKADENFFEPTCLWGERRRTKTSAPSPSPLVFFQHAVEWNGDDGSLGLGEGTPP